MNKILIGAVLALGAGAALVQAGNENCNVPGNIGTTTVVNTGAGPVSVTPLGNSTFRIARMPDNATALPISKAAVIHADTTASARSFNEASGFSLYDNGAALHINRLSGKIDFISPDGSMILSDIPCNSNDSVVIYAPGASGGFYYGGGERGHSLTLNGDSLSMYNRQNYGYTGSDPRISQMGISIPLLINDNGFGILFDSHDKAALEVGDSIIFSTASPGPIPYYVMLGSEKKPASVVEQYTRLTGRQPLPPLWTLGYITSKYGYHNQNEAYGVIDSLQQRGYPVDGIVLDLYWYGKETDMGRLAWDSIQWPQHTRMLADLKQRGVNTVLITQPYVNKIGAIGNYNFLSANGMLAKDSLGNTHDVTTWVGDAGMIDVSNPATAQWLWQRLRPLTQEGVAGWWGDLGEPEVHPATIRHHNGLDAEQYHNRYGNDWSEIIYNGLRADFPSQRPMLMMRGGSAGLQRYGVFPWTTDVSRSWGGLQPQIKLMLSAGMSGLGYMSSDLGGFAVDPAIGPDPELYTRWLQMGAFSPMMRTHAQTTPEPYHFPSVEDISHKYIDIRYQWLPYNYSLAFENALFGWPLARPLNFRGDNPGSIYAGVDDEYFWGDNVLVAPVLNKDARSRKVIFPNGEWISWWNPEKRYRGGSTAIVPAPLDEMPLFIRAGAFIPQAPGKLKNVTGYDPSELVVRYYPSSQPSEYTFYDDDRSNPRSIADSQYQAITFNGRSHAGTTAIDITPKGAYPDMPARRTLTICIMDVDHTPRNVQLTLGHSGQNPVSIHPLENSGNATAGTASPHSTTDRTSRTGYHYNPATHTLSITLPIPSDTPTHLIIR